MEILTSIFLIYMFIGFYIFFLFVLLYIRNRNRLFFSPDYKKAYSVSVLIPAYNEENSIEETVKSVLKSDYPNIEEIIIIDDGSKDKTAEIAKSLVKQYDKIKLIIKKNSGKADSLNQGIKIAKGELIAVVDADSFPKEDSIKKMIGFFEDKKVGGVTSIVFVKNRGKFITELQTIEYLISAFMRKLCDFIDSVWVTPGPLSLYRKSILKEINGFNTSTVTEDIEVAWHIVSKGYKIRMSLGSLVGTIAPTRFIFWFKQRIRWCVGGLQVMYKYRRLFLKERMLGFFVIPFLSSTILLSVIGTLIGWSLIFKKILLTFFYTKYSFLAETSLFKIQNLNFNPSVIFMFIAFLFVLGFGWVSVSLFELKEKRYAFPIGEKLFNRLFYSFVYISLYPTIWVVSIYKFLRGNAKWGTK